MTTGRRRERRWAVTKTALLSGWIALVALFLLWEATQYQGFMALIGEWEFNWLGRQYPTFNYVLLVFLLCLPGYLLFMRPRRRAEAERPEAALVESVRALLKALVGTAIGLAAVALVVLVAMLFLPRDSGDPQLIDLDRTAAVDLAQGPATVSGSVIWERTAGFDEDMLFAHHSVRFVPIVGQAQPSDELRIFVQLPPVDQLSHDGTQALTGVLKRDGLPGEVVRLFRYAGYQVDEPNYVLFLDPAAMRWPYIALIVQLVVGMVLALLFALVQRRRYDSVEREIRSPEEETPSAEAAEAAPES